LGCDGKTYNGEQLCMSNPTLEITQAKDLLNIQLFDRFSGDIQWKSISLLDVENLNKTGKTKIELKAIDEVGNETIITHTLNAFGPLSFVNDYPLLTALYGLLLGLLLWLLLGFSRPVKIIYEFINPDGENRTVTKRYFAKQIAEDSVLDISTNDNLVTATKITVIIRPWYTKHLKTKWFALSYGSTKLINVQIPEDHDGKWIHSIDQ